MRKTTVICCVLFAALMLALPSTTAAQISVGVGISVHIGPPVLPVYAQPVCPGAGYIWTPGYWAYGPVGYYWVPGTWVVAPVGMLWTPGYWGWAGGAYFWHGGYWGPHVGFYGGINYGFGYGGVGFVGGEWRGGVFAYNSAVTNVNTTVIHNTYVNKTVINNTTINNHVSYNGGTGGTTAQPTAAEMAAEHEQHIAPTAEQTQHEHTAASNPSLRYSANHGNPVVAATSKPGEFSGHGVVAARNAEFHPPAHNAATNTQANAHASNTFHPPSNANNNGSHNNNGSNKTYASESHNSKPAPHPQNKPAEHEHEKGKPQK